MKYLYRMSYDELEELIKKKLKIKNWYIYDQSVSERLKNIKTKPYYLELSAQAYKKGIFAKPAEKLSWLDTWRI